MSVPSPVAWLLPGQGVDLAGLGTWARCSDVVRARLEHAGRLAHCDALRLLGVGGRKLEDSAVLQPVFVAAVLGIAEVLLRGGLAPDLCAGHSLGHLPALAIAGALDFDVAIELAAVRGRVMGAAARLEPGGMLALTADEHTIEQALSVGRTRGELCVAGRNTPNRWILSGSEPALRAVLTSFPATRLRVEGAWHSAAMATAMLPWQSALQQAPIHPPRVPVVDGESGRILEAPDDIRRSLLRQLTHPFDWTLAFARLERLGVLRLVAIGPSRFLRELTRENLGRSAVVIPTDTSELARSSLEGPPC